MLSDQRLREIKKRLDRASPGPWKGHYWSEVPSPDRHEPHITFPSNLTDPTIGQFVTNGNGTTFEQDNLNTDFIANSHSDITDLLNMVLEQDQIISQDLLLDSPQAKALYLKGLTKAIDIVLENHTLFNMGGNQHKMADKIREEIIRVEKS